jgi:hypothetical protein
MHRFGFSDRHQARVVNRRSLKGGQKLLRVDNAVRALMVLELLRLPVYRGAG